jgi:hypothetical protein
MELPFLVSLIHLVVLPQLSPFCPTLSMVLIPFSLFHITVFVPRCVLQVCKTSPLPAPLNFPLSFLFLHRIAYHYTILMDYVHGRQLRSVNLAVSFFALSLSPSLSRSVSLLTSQGLPLPCRWPCP